MSRWLHHVAIAAPRNGTTSHSISPAAGTVVAGALFTPTAGNLLVCVVEGAVTSTTPSGWSLGGSAINNTGLYVWYRTAAGADSLTTTHNGSNYPVVFDFYEFPAGSSWVNGVGATGVSYNGGAGPTLTGLSGTNQVYGAGGEGFYTSAAQSSSWSVGTKLVDTYTDGGATDGYIYGSTEQADYTGTSASAAWTTTYPASTEERLMWAVTVPTGGSSYTATPADNAGLTDVLLIESSNSDEMTDPLGLTDSAAVIFTSGGTDYTAAPADTAALSDAVTTSAAIARDQADTTGLTDTAGHTATANSGPRDTTGATDTAAAVLDAARTIVDAAALTDNITADLVAAADVAETSTVGLTDTTTTTAASNRAAGDTTQLSDTIHVQMARVVTVADLLGLIDTASNGSTLDVTLGDTAQVTDQASPSLSSHRPTMDVAGLTDTARAVIMRSVTIADQFTILDALGAAGAYQPRVSPSRVRMVPARSHTRTVPPRPHVRRVR